MLRNVPILIHFMFSPTTADAGVVMADGRFGSVDRYLVKPISNVRKTFDSYLTQLVGIKLSGEEKRMKTGLLEHATGITSDQVTSYEFRTFPSTELEQDLVLVAPRKVTAYVPVALKPEKEKKKRSSTSAGASRAVKPRTTSRAQEIRQEKFFVRDDTAEPGEAVQSALARKMARMSSAGGNTGMEGPAEAIFTSREVSLPKNFYEIINGVFSKFWNMEFDEPSVNQAFFAKIDKSNCSHYGLQNYSESPMCLSVIRDRLEASKQVDDLGGWDQAALVGTKESRDAMQQAYKSNEDFYSDVMAMFTNIHMYFPADSPAFAKGKELTEVFQKDWEEGKGNFQY